MLILALASAIGACTAADTQSELAAIQADLDATRSSYGAPGGMVLLERDGQRSFVSSGLASIEGATIDEDSTFRIPASPR
jgi:hypothetical protein